MLLLLQAGEISKLAVGSLPGFFARHTLRLESLGQHGDVGIDLIVKLAAEKTRREKIAKLEEIADHVWRAKLSRRPMAPEIRRQSSVSWANCFRPLAVMV